MRCQSWSEAEQFRLSAPMEGGLRQLTPQQDSLQDLQVEVAYHLFYQGSSRTVATSQGGAGRSSGFLHLLQVKGLSEENCLFTD